MLDVPTNHKGQDRKMTQINNLFKSFFSKIALYINRKGVFGIILLLPAFITVLFIIVYPIILTIQYSVRDFKLGFTNQEFIGAANYIKMFSDSDFWKALGFSALFTVVSTTIIILIGLGTALLLNRKFLGRAVARVMIVLPWAVPAVISSLIWIWMLDTTYGVINFFLLKLGLIHAPIAWLATRTTSIISLILVMVWKGYPFVTLTILAGLQSIPTEFYEVAKIEGGNAWQQFRMITLPAINQIIRIVIVLTGVWVFREFDTIYVLTAGGPAKATTTLGLMIYKVAFKEFDFGYASAIGILSLLICMLFSLAFLFLRRKRFW